MNQDLRNGSKSEAFLDIRESQMLPATASEQHVYWTYVCLLHDVNPKYETSSNEATSSQLLDAEEVDGELESIQVERSKAVHELIKPVKNESRQESNNKLPRAKDDSDSSEQEDIKYDNPKVLKLTKMKWLSENREEYPDSSSTSIYSALSTTSTYSSEGEGQSRSSLAEKYLSTILRLDKEHNLFGLSSITIVGSKQMRKSHKDGEKAVFHQTAIVQRCKAKCGKCTSCCGADCCRYRTNTDLPASLKCGSCVSCCTSTCNSCCIKPSIHVCKAGGSKPKPKPCKLVCPKSRPSCTCDLCLLNPCGTPCYDRSYGFKIRLKKKFKYEPPKIELTPRNSSILHKPFAARPCKHDPRCIPPSSCFPYFMPCFWPSRPSAPCNDPARCFHVPPCMPGRYQRPCGSGLPNVCPKPGPCVDPKKQKDCSNVACLGKNKDFLNALQSRYSK